MQVHLRAGPARDYPVVAVLGENFPLDVQGCVADYSWCDVIAGQSRGWVYAGNIRYPYRGNYVPLNSYGEVIGIGVLGFMLGDYWGSYYRDRPWYGDPRWSHRPAPLLRARPRPQIHPMPGAGPGAPWPGRPGPGAQAPGVPHVRPLPGAAQPRPSPPQRQPGQSHGAPHGGTQRREGGGPGHQR
jgi:uncharacterized protein YraI